jgi:HTH-type transcriptional regulator/antitoxin HigA
MKTMQKRSAAADRYFALVRELPLKAIRTMAEYERAMEMVSRLAVRGEDDLDSGEADYLEALMILIEGYDAAQAPWKKTTGLELVRHLMQERAMSVTDLGRIVGSRPLASLILSGKRDISKEVMRRLGTHFKVDPGVFM